MTDSSIASLSHSATRETLLARAQAGRDEAAWDELLRFYEPFVRRTLLGMGIDRSAVDDVCQQVLSKLWQELTNYKRDRNVAKFRTWLTRMIINVAINDYHKRKRVQRVKNVSNDKLENFATQSSDHEKMIEMEWQRHLARLAMARVKSVFSENAVEVFLRSAQGQSAQKVSEDLGLTVQSVYVLKSRVKKLLVEEVKQLRHQLEFSDGPDEL